MSKHHDSLIDRLIDWCLTPTLTTLAISWREQISC
jgi:hypothetical protein